MCNMKMSAIWSLLTIRIYWDRKDHKDKFVSNWIAFLWILIFFKNLHSRRWGHQMVLFFSMLSIIQLTHTMSAIAYKPWKLKVRKCSGQFIFLCFQILLYKRSKLCSLSIDIHLYRSSLCVGWMLQWQGIDPFRTILCYSFIFLVISPLLQWTTCMALYNNL